MVTRKNPRLVRGLSSLSARIARRAGRGRLDLLLTRILSSRALPAVLRAT
jgi:hypothetical protein